MSLAVAAMAELELRNRRERQHEDAYLAFQQRYFNDPVGFVQDCFYWKGGARPYFYQLDLLQQVQDNRRVSGVGPHGLGKTGFMSWLVHWFALTRDGRDWKMPITASSWRQLTKYLWPEVHKWARLLRWHLIGRRAYDERLELQSLSLKLRTGEAFTMASNNHELLEGAHAEELLVLFDESKAIEDAIWDAVEGSFSVGNVRFVAMSTPGEPQGRFYAIHSGAPGYEDWHKRKVTLEDCLQAGALSGEWVEARRAQWGQTSPMFQNRVEGNFAASATEGVIPLAWVEAANERWLEWEARGFPGVFTSLAGDVGGGEEGADKSIVATVYDGVKVRELRPLPQGDPHLATMALVGLITGMLEPLAKVMKVPAKRLLAIIDSVGIGLGTLHRLRELDYNAHGFLAGADTKLRDKSGELGFADWRSAMWWLAREMLEPGSGFNVCLPPDREGEDATNLTGDLTAPRWQLESTGKIRVESKLKVRKRIKRSTDYADAVLMALIGPLLLEEQWGEEHARYRVVTGDDL